MSFREMEPCYAPDNILPSQLIRHRSVCMQQLSVTINGFYFQEVFLMLYLLKTPKNVLRYCVSHLYREVLHLYDGSTICTLTHCMKSVPIRSFLWSLFSCVRTEYGDLLHNSPCRARIHENTDQKKLRIWTLFTQ